MPASRRMRTFTSELKLTGRESTRASANTDSHTHTPRLGFPFHSVLDRSTDESTQRVQKSFPAMVLRGSEGSPTWLVRQRGQNET